MKLFFSTRKQPYPEVLRPTLAKRAWDLARSDQGFFLVAMGLNSVFSFLSNLTMARVLPFSAYGVYSSCATLFNFVLILTSAFQNTATYAVAQKTGQGGTRAAWAFLRTATGRLSLAGLVGFGLMLPFSSLLAGFLNAETVLIVYTLLNLLVFLPYALTAGSFQGWQHFRLLGVALTVPSLVRLVAGLGLVWAGLGLGGAVLSLPLSLGVGLVLNFGLLVWLYRRQGLTRAAELIESPQAAQGEIRRLFLTVGSSALVGTLGLALLTSLDLLVVQHLAPGPTAGHYAVIATLGRIVLYFVAPISLILLPKAIELHLSGGNPVPLLRRTMAVTFGLGGLALAGLVVGGGFVAGLFAQDFPPELSGLIALHGGAMLLYSLVTVWVTFFIAIRRYAYLLAMLPALGLQLALLLALGTNLGAVIAVLWGVGGGLYGLGEWCLWRYRQSVRS